jgi:Sensors of blue-light using FAD
MSLVQLIYASQPFGYDSVGLYNILSVSRSLNERDGLTGALICRADVYLQLLEGPQDKIDATYARIFKDDRHLDAQILLTAPIKQRLFPQWAMHHDPANSLMWTQDEVDKGALHTASPDALHTVFKRILAH